MRIINSGRGAAELSLRAVTALEITSVVISVLITVWVVIPLQPGNRWLAAVPILLALALMIHSHRLRGETARELGFAAAHFGRALRLLVLPMLVGGAVIAGVGYVSGSFHTTTHFWTTLLFLPAWGIFQQYILQGFIYRRLRSILVRAGAAEGERGRQVHLAILAAAALFALVHAPNLVLMGLTFIAGLVWSWVYERAPNLFALGLSHGVMSLLIMTALPPWALESLSVGYKHFLYQKF
jgi:membrane protease YdiL (CAAX protease family)